MTQQVSGQSDHHGSDPAWWNPWHWPMGIWALAIGAVLLILPFGIRAVLLQGVPSMAEPFDIAEFSKWDVLEGDDAFPEYRRASEQRSKIADELQAKGRQDPESTSAVLQTGWSESDDALKEWLKAYSEPLATWRRGTERNHALNQRPDTLSLDLDTVVSIIQDQRFFCRMALCEQAKAQAESRYEESYQWARAAFRCGGHCSHRGCLIQALVGAASHAMACRGLQRWSAQAPVTEEQLQQALATAKADYELYETRSNILKAEYLAVRNSLASSRWLQVTGAGGAGSNDTAMAQLMRFGFWMVGEPELSARLFRQMLANQVHEVDKPMAQRRKHAGNGLAMLFDPDPAVPLLPGQLDPARIDQGIKKSLVLQALAPSVKQVDTVLLRQEARQQALVVMLALQAYRRRHGDFPAALAALVPDYLNDVPLDSCDRAGSPLLYRRDGPLQATVWSVGDDGTDSGGEVDSETSQPPDVGFTLQ